MLKILKEHLSIFFVSYLVLLATKLIFVAFGLKMADEGAWYVLFYVFVTVCRYCFDDANTTIEKIEK